MGRVHHLEGDGHEAEPVTEEQIIGILREHEAGAKTADVCRKHGISSATFYKWEAIYGAGLLVRERYCDDVRMSPAF
jgi:transposase-like protein